ncbi:IS66 family transposase [Blautia sp.]|uniref:Transposase IS66 family protein n=1 Tax=Blautia glucerasea TaxID=536633 RepID=A0A6N2U4A9_9FIRM
MRVNFEYDMHLQYENRALKARIRELESGAAYVRMQEECEKRCREMEREVRKLKTELENAVRQLRQNREHWFQVYGDMEKEHKKVVERKQGEIRRLQKLCEKTAIAYEQMHEKYLEQLHLRYAAESALEEEKGKNQKLRAQLNRDYENSSIPSSKSLRPKKVANSREKTGRKPGAQPGHKGHCRKKQEPTVPTVFLPPPEAVLEDPDFKKTAKTIIKQLVSIRMVLDVTEYHADVYYNAKTGERVHAAFPDGVINDVNYDGSIRAFLFLLNNDCCASIDKSRKFLSDLTGGKLNISKGMISREFALKTEPERRAAYADMLFSPVMHTDCTNARENGKGCYVYVCATPDGKALYFARAKKGHEGVKGTVAEDYQGILVHDHDITFYSYGTDHQECLAHVLRYLKDSMDNEPGRVWNKEMHGLIQEMIHFRNETLLSCNLDPEKISGFEERYLKILETARKEYEDIPANAYYKDGYNQFLGMEKYMQNHLLFLHDFRVPATNNEAERLLRNYKRKQAQAVTFRSFESIENLCQCMSMLVLMRLEDPANIYDRVSRIFG